MPTPDLNAELSPRLWWAVPAAIVLLLMGLGMLVGDRAPDAKRGTSYDASRGGFRAAYLLLEDLGYPVTRSKRLAGGAARFVLFPQESRAADEAALDSWVRESGGTLVLATEEARFGLALGMELRLDKVDPDPGPEAASGSDARRLAGGPTFVDWPGHPGRVWARAGDRPVVTVYPRGRGAVWLINRPGFLSNGRLQEADNAVLLCRLAEEVLRDQSGPLAFDEFFHGLRERPGVSQLLLQPPARWVTLQATLLLSLLLWRCVPRFGSLRRLTNPSRRSKEEFLNALAGLLERKQDYAGAYRTAHEGLLRDVGQELGLAPGAAAERVREAARGRPGADLLEVVLGRATLPAGARRANFLHALNQLEDAHHEFLGRHHR